MFVNGYMKNYKYVGDDTVLEIVIPNERLTKLYKYGQEGKAPLGLRIDDGRTISNDQRKKIYATLKDIAFHLGYMPEELKEIMKYIHIAKTGCSYFSLSECSITTAREFINTILEFALRMDVPLSDLALNRTDDMAAWLIMAYIYGRCCICGKKGEKHHVDAVGMGRDRKDYDDSEHEMISLCRKHHGEAHTLGVESFFKKYIVFGIKKKYLEG